MWWGVLTSLLGYLKLPVSNENEMKKEKKNIPTAQETSSTSLGPPSWLTWPLLVVRRPLFVVRCPLSVVRCSLFVLVVRCTLFVVRCSFVRCPPLSVVGRAGDVAATGVAWLRGRR